MSSTSPGRPATLTRDRVLAAAIGLADREGLAAVSMRRVGQEVGVEAMSLYTHVKGKDDLLAAMADAVVGEIPVTTGETGQAADWQAALRATIVDARAVMLRHSWAPRILELRGEPGPLALRYLDGVMGIMRRGSLSLAVTHHALHVLGSRLMGFTQDLFDDSTSGDPAMAAAIAAQLGPTHPYVAELALGATHEGGLGGCDDDVEFAVALDLILDGLARLQEPRPA